MATGKDVLVPYVCVLPKGTLGKMPQLVRSRPFLSGPGTGWVADASWLACLVLIDQQDLAWKVQATR